MIFAPLFLSLALVTSWTEAPGVGGVAVFINGSARALSATELRSAGDLNGVRAFWIWSAASAPRRFDVDQLPANPLKADRGRLRIRVPGKKEEAAAELPELVTRAAPKAMWDEVPEPLLPSWRLAEGSEIGIPHDPNRAWRVRLVGEERGTWWQDVRVGQSLVDVAPTFAESFTISFVDEDDQRLSGVSLKLLEAGPRGRPMEHLLARYAADSEGEVRLEALPDLETLMMLAVEPSHVPAGTQGRPSSLPAQLVLERGATVAGNFVDHKGLPVAGVKVGLTAFVAAEIPVPIVRPVIGAEDGSWQVAGLPIADVGLVAQAEGFAPLIDRIEVNAAAIDLGALTLRRSGVVRFLVVDDQEEPVAGARVNLPPALAAHCDLQGFAEIDRAPADTVLTGQIEAAGFVAKQFRAEAPWADPIIVELTRSFAVQGRFLDADGIAVVDGKVKIETGSRFTSEPVDSGGRFEVELPPHTPARLELSSASTAALLVSIGEGAPGESRDLGDLVAPRGLVATGRVIGALDGNPIAGARVWALRDIVGRTLLSWVTSDLVEAVTGAEGFFRLSGLAPRPALLRIEAPGFARHQLDLNPKPDRDTVDVGEVELKQGVTVRILSDEESTAGAVARVDLGNAWLEPDMLIAPVDRGVAVVKHVPAGRVTISVIHGSQLVCDKAIIVPEGGEPVDVECNRSGMVVRGTVEVGGYPVGPGLLSWGPAETRAHSVVLEYGTLGGVVQRRALAGGRPAERVPVDAVGYFESDRLRPGTWRVMWSSSSDSSREPQLVVLPEAEQYDLVLSFPRLTVRGVVAGADGAAVDGARIHELTAGAFAFSADDGTFAMGVSEGSLKLQARLGERTSDVVRVEAVADREPELVRLVLEDRERDKITVSVLGPDERPVADALVFLQEESKTLRILTTDSEGRASALIHPPHPTRIRAAAVAGGLWELGDWQSLEASWAGLQLATEQGGSLRVSTERAAEPVQVGSPGGWDVSWLLTRLGRRPVVEPGRPLLLEGLPPGTYEVSVDSAAHRVVVKSGETEEVFIR